MHTSQTSAEPFDQLRARIESACRWTDALRAIASPAGAGPEAGAPNGAGSRRETEFTALALALFRFQYENVPIYRSFCEARGTRPERVNDWRQIPALPTTAFRDFEVTSLAPDQRSRVFHSSGTTAHRPSRQFHDAGSLALYETSLRPWFRRHLLPLGESLRWLALTPRTVDAPHSSLAHMIEVAAQSFAAPGSHFVGRATATGWQLDFAAALDTLTEAARSGKPLFVPGTAFGFVQLLDHLAARDRSFQLPARSRVMETGGYKGRSRELPKSELHALISQRLGIAPEWIVTEYGMSELSSQAYDAIAGVRGERVLRFPPWARFQVVSPETGRPVGAGETGLLRVFDLANIRSMMAIQTEDLARAEADGLVWLSRAATAVQRGCSLLVT